MRLRRNVLAAKAWGVRCDKRHGRALARPVATAVAIVALLLTGAATSDGGHAANARPSSRTLPAIGAGTFPHSAGSVLVGTDPQGIAIDAATGEVGVANSGSSNVSLICDGSPYCGTGFRDRVISTLSFGPASPFGLAFEDKSGQLFVTGGSSINKVAVFNATTGAIVTVVGVGAYPYGIVYDSAKGEMFVANDGSDNVTVISGATDTVVANISVGSEPYLMAYDPAKGEVFVSNAGSDNVSVISDARNSVVATVSLPSGSGPAGAAYDSATGDVFVTDQLTNNVSVVSDATNTVVATVPVGPGPVAVVSDPAQGWVFVANYGWYNVTVIADTSHTVIGTVSVGNAPMGIVYDAAQAEEFVANLDSANVTVIADAPTPHSSSGSGAGGLSLVEGLAVGLLVGAVVGSVGVSLVLRKRAPRPPAESTDRPPSPPPGATP